MNRDEHHVPNTKKAENTFTFYLQTQMLERWQCSVWVCAFMFLNEYLNFLCYLHDCEMNHFPKATT